MWLKPLRRMKLCTMAGDVQIWRRCAISERTIRRLRRSDGIQAEVEPSGRLIQKRPRVLQTGTRKVRHAVPTQCLYERCGEGEHAPIADELHSAGRPVPDRRRERTLNRVRKIRPSRHSTLQSISRPSTTDCTMCVVVRYALEMAGERIGRLETADSDPVPADARLDQQGKRQGVYARATLGTVALRYS